MIDAREFKKLKVVDYIDHILNASEYLRRGDPYGLAVAMNASKLTYGDKRDHQSFYPLAIAVCSLMLDDEIERVFNWFRVNIDPADRKEVAGILEDEFGWDWIL